MDKKSLLKEKRTQIDEIDSQIFKLIAERITISKDISEIKKSLDVEIEDKGREQEVIEKIRQIAVDNNADPQFFEKIARELIAYCKEIQLTAD